MKKTLFACLFFFMVFSCQKKSFLDENEKIAIVKESFSSDIKYWEPTEDDLVDIEKLLIDTEEKGNFKFLEERKKVKRYKDFYLQYVCSIDEKGDKIVFINAICHISEEPILDKKTGLLQFKKTDRWRKEIISVEDGGSCYWNLRINLTKKIVYEINVNGLA